MELQNGTENRIRELDKNVWEYCIMEHIIETLTARLNQIRFSDDDFNTKLNTISSIQTEFDDAVNKIGFFNKKLLYFNYNKLIKNFDDAVINAKNQIENLANETKNNEQEQIRIKKCNLKIQKIFDSLGLTYKRVSQLTDLIVDANYYKYDDKTCSVIELGKYKSNASLPTIISNNDRTYSTYYYFDKDDEINMKDKYDLKILIETSKKTEGGKPKKSRRHKNKKRRSSRRKN